VAEHPLSEPYLADTDVVGMWLFLATEILFFGALFFVYLVFHHLYPLSMEEGAKRTDLAFGSINAGLLVTSSLAMSVGIARPRWMRRAFAASGLLGLAFLTVKGLEYAQDFQEGLFPGPHFVAVTAQAGPEQIFFIFYFIATALHSLHMVVGLGLILYAMRGKGSPMVVALYWSFVDIVWICLYPLLYLVGRGGG
jgi:cytochrome c oxidase subunit 3